ncbi:NAD(P)/FAD-dependent oxidoreductase [Hydrogenimonas sp.]
MASEPSRKEKAAADAIEEAEGKTAAEAAIAVKKLSERIYDAIILGAGAAGLMAAAHLKRKSVAILEHNPKPGAKIAISGGGRCNITNAELSPSRYLGDPSFIESVFSQFDNHDLIEFLHRHGLEPVVRKENQYFCPDRARELIDTLLRAGSGGDFSGNEFFYDTEVNGAVKENGLFVVDSSRGIYRAKKLIVSTGGLSYKSVGAGGVGLQIAEAFGHGVRPPNPALVGLTLQPEQAWMRSLSGLSLPVEIGVGRRVLKEDMLFTHKGISGPAVLNASLYWKQGKIVVDFLPKKRIKTLLKSPTKSAASQIPLPKRFVRAFFDSLDIPNIPYKEMNEIQKQRLSLLKSYAFAPAGTFGFTKAEVTKGGVDTDQIDPYTMQSRLTEGLYFAGEVIDVTGEIGGYNFQWAFSSAVVAAKSI